MRELLMNRLPAGFATFLVVGAIGFVVDASILVTLIHQYGWGDYTARVVSFAIAVIVTWLLNRRFTFASGATSRRGREYTRYLTVQILGVVINFSIYAVGIATVPIMDRWPVLALAAGVMVQIPVTFLGMRKFVFTGNQDSNH